MSLENEIIKALKAEGYRITETIRDALDEFIEVVEDEAESLEMDDADEENELDSEEAE